MGAVLPLDKMTTQEKLRALEAIWDDLSHAPEDIPSPSCRAKNSKVVKSDWPKV